MQRERESRKLSIIVYKLLKWTYFCSGGKNTSIGMGFCREVDTVYRFEWRVFRFMSLLVCEITLLMTLNTAFTFYLSSCYFCVLGQKGGLPYSLYSPVTRSRLYWTDHIRNCFRVILVKRLVTWYYRRKLTHSQEKLHDMRERKKKLLEDVMDNETYKVAKEILEKFAPDQLQKSSVSWSWILILLKKGVFLKSVVWTNFWYNRLVHARGF